MLTSLLLVLSLAQVSDTSCAVRVRPSTDSLRAETYRSQGVRKTVVRRHSTRVDSIAATCLVPAPPPDPTPPYTIVIRQPDSVLAIPPGVPAQTSIRATVDSGGVVVADSARLSLAPAQVTAAWDASVRRWRLHTPTAPGKVVLTWEYRGATVTTALTITGQADTTPPSPPPPPPPVDTTTPPPTAGFVGPAELPRAVPKFPASLATATCTQTIAATGLQAAVGAARAGGVLCLAPGDRFRGTLTLPRRADSGWVVVRTIPAPGQPAPGERVRPSQRTTLATLEAPGTSPALVAAPGARGWYLGVLEVTTDSSLSTLTSALINLPAGPTPADFPRDLVFDRVWAHGWAHRPLRRCVSLQSAATTIVNSWFDDCHEKGSDSQAIAGWAGPGPFRIENNTLAGAGENVMFGGADPAFVGVHPSDVTLRRNHLVTPLAWKGVWTKKNLLETKNVRRILIEENVLEGSWPDGQTGIAILIKSANQSGATVHRNSGTRDAIVRRNLIRNAAGIISVNGQGGDLKAIDSLTRRVAVIENYADSIGLPAYGPFDTRPVSFFTQATDVVFRSNTWLTPPSVGQAYTAGSQAEGGANTRLTIDGDARTRGQYGIFGCWTSACAPGLSMRAALIGAPMTTLPGVTFTTTLDAALAQGYGVSRATIDAAVRGVVVAR